MTEAAAAASDNTSSGVENVAGGNAPVIEAPSYKGTKHKIDFDGYEVELDYDTLVNDFKKHAKDAYTYKQQLTPLQEFQQAIQSGNLDILEQMIPDDILRDFSEKKLLKFIELQNMDPKEKAFREREARIEAMEKKYEAEKKAQEEQAWQAEKVKANQQVQQDLVEAAKDAVGDGKLTPRFMRRIAEQMYAKLSQGLPTDGKSIAKSEWSELANEYTEYQSTMLRKDPSAFVTSLPPELIQAIRDHDLKASRPFSKPEVRDDSEEIPLDPKKPIDIWKQLDKHFDKKRKKLSNQ